MFGFAAAVVLPTSAVTAWMAIARGTPSVAVAAASLVLFAAAELIGMVVVSYWLDGGREPDAVAALVVGVFSLQLGAFVSILLEVDAILTGGLMVASAAALAALRWRRCGFHLVSVDREAIAMMLVVGLFVGIWSLQNLAGLSVRSERVVSAPWQDTFYHAMWIGHFARNSGASLHANPYVAGDSIPPYHYAGYMLPALISTIAGVSAYDTAVGVFAPLSLFLTGTTAYVFGRTLQGPMTGLITALLVLALPDPSFYVHGNRWMSYFFFQEIAGNGACGTALLGLAWTWALAGAAAGHRAPMVLALIAGAVVSAFKSQIFLAYSFALLPFVLLTFPRLSWRRKSGLLAAAVVALPLSGALLASIAHAPTFKLGTTGAIENLPYAVATLSPAWRLRLSKLDGGYWLFLTRAMPFMLVAYFGLWLSALMLSLSARVRAALPPVVRLFPWIVVANFLVVAFGLEANLGYGDPFEVTHKTFVWPYFALAVWTGLAASVQLGGERFRGQWTSIGVVCGAAALLLPLDLGCARSLQNGFVFPGSETLINITFPRGEFEAAEYLRTNSAPGSIVQLLEPDPLVTFVALSERHAYVANFTVNVPPNPQVLDHLARVNALETLDSADELRRVSRSLGIDYVVVPPTKWPAWSVALAPVFESGGYRVYRL